MNRIHAMRSDIASLHGTSEWMAVTQARIDAFAEATEDRQFIHIDPARAATSSFGGTVAHGFLTVSLLSHLLADANLPLPESRESINYGFDSLRFLAPVHSGARIRGVFAVTGIDERGDDCALLHLATTVQIEGMDRPALVAQWLALLILAPKD